VVTDPDCPARIVLGVRADLYRRCAEYPDLVAALQDAELLVGPMSAAELREAVTGPAAMAGLTVEGALVSTVVADATGRPGALPLVSHVLMEVWQRRRGIALTLAGYQAVGGIHGAVARTAERMFHGLDNDAKQVARGVLLRLAALGDGAEGGGRPVPWSDFASPGVEANTVLCELAGARLITLGRDTVELAHEAMMTAWSRFGRWIDEDRAGLRIQRQLTDGTQIWLAHDRDADDLYRGIRLQDAEQWSRRDPGRITEAEEDFLEASCVARRTATVRRRRAHSILIALIAGVTVSSTLAAWALSERSQARGSPDQARSRR
jgi:hypothetical protein